MAVNSTSRASTKSAEFEGQGFNWISIRTQVDPAVLGFSEPVQLHNRSVLLQHRVDVDTQRKVLQNSPRLLLTLNHLAPFSVSAVYGIFPTAFNAFVISCASGKLGLCLRCFSHESPFPSVAHIKCFASRLDHELAKSVLKCIESYNKLHRCL